MRTVFFFLFNLSCSYSIIFIQDDVKQKVELAKQSVVEMVKLKKAVYKLYEVYTLKTTSKEVL